MKRLALAVALLATAACTAQEEAPVVDSAAMPAAAPAPMIDSVAPLDTTVVDTTAMPDSIVPPPAQ